MRIWDMNVALGATDVKGEKLTPERLIKVMDDYRIDRAVAYHTLAKFEHRSGNAEMARISKESNGRIGMCAVIDPVLGADSLYGQGTFVQRLKSCGAEAIRVFPTELRVTFSPFYFKEILEAAEELSMPILVDENLTSPIVHPIFSYLPDMAESYPSVKFVFMRYGICCQRHILPLVTRCKNVYFTIEKMLDYHQIEEICVNGGDDKLLFGSGYPALPYAGTMGLGIYADISEKEREGIFSKNWEAIRYDNT